MNRANDLQERARAARLARKVAPLAQELQAFVAASLDHSGIKADGDKATEAAQDTAWTAARAVMVAAYDNGLDDAELRDAMKGALAEANAPKGTAKAYVSTAVSLLVLVYAGEAQLGEVSGLGFNAARDFLNGGDGISEEDKLVLRMVRALAKDAAGDNGKAKDDKLREEWQAGIGDDLRNAIRKEFTRRGHKVRKAKTTDQQPGEVKDVTPEPPAEDQAQAA